MRTMNNIIIAQWFIVYYRKFIDSRYYSDIAGFLVDLDCNHCVIKG
jgi:hypothetical protein